MNLKAVIIAAGYGSRFFPVTKVIDKAMLPVGTKPIIHHLVEDCVLAGISDIVVVTQEGRSQIEQYFTEDVFMRDYFREKGWHEKYASISSLHDMANFTFVQQPVDGRYGTAVPLMVAQHLLDGSEFVLLSSDDLVLNRDGSSSVARMLDEHTAARSSATMSVTSVPPSESSHFGVVETVESRGHLYLAGINEKSARGSGGEQGPVFANISRYVLPAEILPLVDDLTPNAGSGEFQLTDALEAFGKEADILVHRIESEYYDCGRVNGWIAANSSIV